MTTDLEKQFFDTFEIEPDTSEVAYFTGNMGYPQITDRMWLELVRIYASRNIFLLRKNMEDFKYDILTGLIERPYEYRKQIRELFKGE